MIDSLWTTLLLITVLSGYITASKSTNRIPAVPLGLFVTYLLLRLLMILLGEYDILPDWTRHIQIAADVVLAWAVARIVFHFLVRIHAIIRPEKHHLPKITRDFILFLTFAILFFVVLHVRSNINMAGLLTTSAVLTAVIGLAAQATLSNFFSGLIIQAERPFAIGDWIQFNGSEGRVIGISWKSTQIMTRDHILVYIPNSVLAASTFVNYSKPTRKKVARLCIGLEYGTEPNKVQRVISEVLDQNPKVLRRPRPTIRLIEFGDFAITYEIRFWHESYQFEPQLKADINQQLWYALNRHNIRIPYPIRDVFHGHVERRHNQRQGDIMSSEIETLLANVSILSPLSDAERRTIASQVKIDIYGKGEYIVREGEVGDSMYIIRSGACEATKKGEDGETKQLSTMRSGEFFGEISLLTGERRSATVIATEDTWLIAIDKAVFSSVMIANPLISEPIGQMVAERQQREGVSIEDPASPENRSMNVINKIKIFFFGATIDSSN